MKVLKNPALKLLALLLPAMVVLLLVTSPSYGDMNDHALPQVLSSTDYSLCMAGALLAAALLMALLQRKQKTPVDAMAFTCMAAPLGLVGARLCYCLARYKLFLRADRWTEIFHLTYGGYLMYGALAGVVLAAWLYSRLTGLHMMKVLDAAAVPGLLMVALGRFAEHFTTAGRGDDVFDGLLTGFPFAAADEWGFIQLTPYIWEGMIALILMAVVWAIYRGGKGSFMLALILYACCQAVLESVPEGVCMLGFVRVSQVTSGVIVLGVTAWRAFRKLPRGMAILRTVLCVLMIAVIGIMEWGLDKLNASNVLLYTVMLLASVAMAANCLTLGRE